MWLLFGTYLVVNFLHLTISSPFISVNQKKCIKTTVTFGIDFCLLLAFIICTCLSVLLLFISGFFYVNISVSGLSGKISLHGSKQLSLYS